MKYGLGIVFDMSKIALDTRVMEEGSVQSDFGDLKKMPDGYVLMIPDHTIRDEPIALTILQAGANAEIRLRVHVGKGSRVTLIEKSDVKEYQSVTVEVQVGERAMVNYVIMQNLHDTAYRISSYKAMVGTHASLTWFDIELGGNIVGTDIQTELAGEEARGETYGIFFGTGETSYDIHHDTRHTASRTFSHMETKGLLDMKAKAIYLGKIRIEKGAEGCNGYEREDTLLLSKDAQVRAVPELEIGNNDVKCAHAVTTSRIDEEKMFYLRSRGIGDEQARRLAVLGHVGGVIEKIPGEEIQKEIMEDIEKRL